MHVKGIEPERVRRIVEEVGARQFGGNISFVREPERYRGGVRFTLRVRSCTGPGHRVGFHRTSRGNRRRLTAACYHAYGEVIRALLVAGASKIETAPSVAERRRGGPGALRWSLETFAECAARVAYRNVGSGFDPIPFYAACECGIEGMPEAGHDYDSLPAKIERAHPLGTARVTMIPQGAVLRCKFFIFTPEHYRADGSCKCDSASHRAMMIAEWEYSEGDFSGPATKP